MNTRKIIAPPRLAGFYAIVQHDEQGNLLVEIPLGQAQAHGLQDMCSEAVGVPVQVLTHDDSGLLVSLVFTCAPGVVTFEDGRRVDS